MVLVHLIYFPQCYASIIIRHHFYGAFFLRINVCLTLSSHFHHLHGNIPGDRERELLRAGQLSRLEVGHGRVRGDEAHLGGELGRDLEGRLSRTRPLGHGQLADRAIRQHLVHLERGNQVRGSFKNHVP